MNRIVLASLAALLGASAFAAPVTYILDPEPHLSRASPPTISADFRFGAVNSTPPPARWSTTRPRSPAPSK